MGSRGSLFCNEMLDKLAGRHIGAFLVFLLLLLPLTRGAAHFYPKLDDATMELIVKENGKHALPASLVFRPVHGWIVDKAVLSGHDRSLGLLAQFAGWSLLGVITLVLWSQLFPDKRRYGAIAACLVIAPLILKGQLSTWFFVVPVNLAVVLSYGAGVLLWRYVRQGSSRAALYLFLAALLTFAGGMVSEYGTLSSVASSILLLSFVVQVEKPVRARALQSILALLITAAAAHLLYVHIAVAHPQFSGPSYTAPLSEVVTHLGKFGSRFFRALWYCMAGAYASSIASVGTQTARSVSAITTLYAIIVAAALAFACRNPTESAAPVNPEPRMRVLMLMLATCVTLAPAVLLSPILVGRDLHMEDMSTRFYLVAAPLAIALMLRALFALTRQRLWFLLPVAFGLMAGDAVMQQLHTDAVNNEIMHSMGAVLRPFVEDNPDQTVVLTPDFYGRDLEMEAKATADWPVDLSRRLSILWEARGPVVLGAPLPGRASACADIQTIDRNTGTILRRGHIAHLLWIEPLPQGGFRVEPYCLGKKP